MRQNQLVKLIIATFFSIIFFMGTAKASDHIDGPITTGEKHGDLTDLFVFKGSEPNSMVMALNTYPMAPRDAHFDEKLRYTFIIRLAHLQNEKIATLAGSERRIVCTFSEEYLHQIRTYCETSGGLVETAVQDTKHIGTNFNLFTGLRSDPFFFDMNWVGALLNDGKIIPSSEASKENAMAQLNALSIVIELPLTALYPTYVLENPSYYYYFLAVTALVEGKDSPDFSWKTVDWVGRPELTNFSMDQKGQTELRDRHNQAGPYYFESSSVKNKALHGQVTQRLRYKIFNHYDSADSKPDWIAQEKNHLLQILTYDYLTFHPGLPCDGEQYFAIEWDVFAKGATQAQSCGGRKLTDDVSDQIMSMYVTGELDELDDGINDPYKEPQTEFPYLANPDLSDEAAFKAWMARTMIGVKGWWDGLF